MSILAAHPNLSCATINQRRHTECRLSCNLYVDFAENRILAATIPGTNSHPEKTRVLTLPRDLFDMPLCSAMTLFTASQLNVV
jgi:hypothetical protein